MRLGIGRSHHSKAVIVLINGLNATTTTNTGEVLAKHHVNADRHDRAKTQTPEKPARADSAVHDAVRNHTLASEVSWFSAEVSHESHHELD